MQTLPNMGSRSPAEMTPDLLRARRIEDAVYRVMTVCAILLVLGSLWIF